jgi:hypothetical protein
MTCVTNSSPNIPGPSSVEAVAALTHSKNPHLHPRASSSSSFTVTILISTSANAATAAATKPSFSSPLPAPLYGRLRCFYCFDTHHLLTVIKPSVSRARSVPLHLSTTPGSPSLSPALSQNQNQNQSLYTRIWDGDLGRGVVIYI